MGTYLCKEILIHICINSHILSISKWKQEKTSLVPSNYCLGPSFCLLPTQMPIGLHIHFLLCLWKPTLRKVSQQLLLLFLGFVHSKCSFTVISCFFGLTILRHREHSESCSLLLFLCFYFSIIRLSSLLLTELRPTSHLSSTFFSHSHLHSFCSSDSQIALITQIEDRCASAERYSA